MFIMLAQLIVSTVINKTAMLLMMNRGRLFFVEKIKRGAFDYKAEAKIQKFMNWYISWFRFTSMPVRFYDLYLRLLRMQT